MTSPYKALFLDLDETLCDTTGANHKALDAMSDLAAEFFPRSISTHIKKARFSELYLDGIYREMSTEFAEKLLPVTDEGRFRLDLIELILQNLGETNPSLEAIQALQDCFDNTRKTAFDFFSGIKDWLVELRTDFTLVVITNGPEFSQRTKVETVNLESYVDHILIGGLEPEQKPAKSIFDTALKLANCKASEVIHIGDSLACDIKGAHNAGIECIWVRHDQSYDKALAEDPDHIVDHPKQLPDLLKQIL